MGISRPFESLFRTGIVPKAWNLGAGMGLTLVLLDLTVSTWALESFGFTVEVTNRYHINKQETCSGVGTRDNCSRNVEAEGTVPPQL